MDLQQFKAHKFQNKLRNFCVLFHEKERGEKGKGRRKEEKKEKEKKKKVEGTDLLIYGLINGKIIC